MGGPLNLLVTCHRRESWGDGLADIAAALRAVAEENLATITFVLHPNPAIASRMRGLLGPHTAIRLSPPCDHRSMIRAMLDCDLVLSDSGGLQEEAAALGVPLLVLRSRTERPEAIASGNMRIAGTSTSSILREVGRVLPPSDELARMSNPSTVFGDGDAADRIAAIISARATGEITREAYGVRCVKKIAPQIQPP
jgi:UDP-N-acetylglucosamine 2-epimerase (non-hydrolysing)